MATPANRTQNGSGAQPAWSDVHRWRQQFRAAFPEIRRLPITSSLAAWLIEHIQERAPHLGRKMTILDVGAGNRLLERKLQPVASLIEYKSQDIDRQHSHDYYDTASISNSFDMVASAEVIEHLDAPAKLAFVEELFRLTAPGGWVALTTPNAQHPTVFWRDFTHVMPMHYLDLAGALGRAGFTDVSVHRLVKMTWKKRLRAWWYSGLLRLLHCDFAQSIMAVGRRPE